MTKCVSSDHAVRFPGDTEHEVGEERASGGRVEGEERARGGRGEGEGRAGSNEWRPGDV